MSQKQYITLRPNQQTTGNCFKSLPYSYPTICGNMRKNTIKTTPKDTSECGWPFRSHPWSQWGQRGPQGALIWEWTNAPHKGLGGGTQRNLSSATAPAVTTQEPTEDFRECHPSQRHRHQESLSSSAVGQRRGMNARNQAYLFYSRGTRSRLSRETPRSPPEQSSWRTQELCCEVRNIEYIFSSTITSLLASIGQPQRVLSSKVITF